jgi:hypothetical protein
MPAPEGALWPADVFMMSAGRVLSAHKNLKFRKILDK